MRTRTGMLGATALLSLSLALVGCGSDPEPQTPGGQPPATTGAVATTDPATDPTTGGDSATIDFITYPAGAIVTEIGTDQKRYEITGMTLDEVKAFFEGQIISAGYTRAAEANASRFYDKGTTRIQVTWSDQSGTIRGNIRVTRR